jgi:hypothetical protein
MEDPFPVPHTVLLSNFASDPSSFLIKESSVPARMGINQGFELLGHPHTLQKGESLPGIITYGLLSSCMFVWEGGKNQGQYYLPKKLA